MAAASERISESRLALAVLNAGLVMHDTFAGSAIGRLRALSGHPPFARNGVVEIPLYSPLDCDLLGLPTPQQDTPPELLAYARSTLCNAAASSSGIAMVTFHDWIVAGGNRLVLLDDVLTRARETGTDVSTIATSPHWLPDLAVSRREFSLLLTSPHSVRPAARPVKYTDRKTPSTAMADAKSRQRFRGASKRVSTC